MKKDANNESSKNDDKKVVKRIIVSLVIIAICLLIVLIKAHVICFHSWQDETCEAPRTCVKCGKTEGKPLGHSWKSASCETPMPNFIYSKSPLFSMVFRVLGTHSAPIPHQFFAAHHF